MGRALEIALPEEQTTKPQIIESLPEPSQSSFHLNANPQIHWKL